MMIGAIKMWSKAKWLVLVALCVTGACDRADEDTKGTRNNTRANQVAGAARSARVVATVDDVKITVGELEARINSQDPYVRRRYQSRAQKKQFLDAMIRFEVLAKEAEKQGLDKHPDVVRTMKQVMIQRLMRKQLDGKIKPEDITEADMRAYYDAHRSDFDRPEQVRVAAIILKSRSKAKRAAELAKSVGQTNKGFRELVDKYSTDPASKLIGGDLRYLGRDHKDLPSRVVQAAFALANIGDVSEAIAGGNGKYYVLKQTGRRRALARGFDAVRGKIQNRLYRRKRRAAQAAFVKKLRENAKIEVNTGALDRVKIDRSRNAIRPVSPYTDVVTPSGPSSSSAARPK